MNASFQLSSPRDPSPESRGEPFHLGYRPWLDGLRGVAIIAVLAQHLDWLTGGFLGVDLFFVLSGFLITTLLVEEWQRNNSVSLRRFYTRRALRLFPALTFVLVAGILYTHFFRTAEDAAAFRREAIVAGSYIANWQKLHDVPMPTLGHTWSLSLEEQFYLIWPILLLVLLRMEQSGWMTRRKVLMCVIGGIVASGVIRFAIHQSYRAAGPKNTLDILRMYQGLDTRADALLTGCLIGLLAVWGLLPAKQWARRAVAAFAFLALVPLALLTATRHFGHPQFYDGLFTLIALTLGLILIHLLVNPAPLWRWVLEFPLLVGFGRISYGLYLVHMPLIMWIRPDGMQHAHWPEKLFVAALAIGVAVLSFYLVERPFLRLKGRSWANTTAVEANPQLCESSVQPEQPRKAA